MKFSWQNLVTQCLLFTLLEVIFKYVFAMDFIGYWICSFLIFIGLDLLGLVPKIFIGGTNEKKD